MEDVGVSLEATSSCEGQSELNGKDATYRTASMISAPRTIRKLRIRGALVPMPQREEP